MEEPYLSGRWKGGKAVIEYARDLSYTLVSIYDKEGNRQRIYSVRTKFTEQVVEEESGGTEPVVDVDNNTGGQKTASQASASNPSVSNPSSNAAPNVSYEWDDSRGAYVPVVAGQASASTQNQESSSSQTPRRHKHHHTEAVVASAQTSKTAAASSKSNSYPAPMAESGVWFPDGTESKTKPKSSGKSSASSSAATGQVKVANTTWVEHRDTSADVQQPETPKRKSKSASDEWVPKSVEETPPPPPPRSSRSQAASANVADAGVPTTEELITGSSAKASPETSAKAGPDTSASDHWVPKAAPVVPQVAPEPVQPAYSPEPPPQVAMVPKAKPVDNSVDNLLRMAEQGKGEMPHDSDKWVPKQVAAPASETDLNKEIARAKAQERQEQAAAKPKPLLKHDISNPEEGVLPVSSFEKFSGPLYGRHREYERRFYPGKNAKSKIPHDFYVDEVDRKKEIHNIYYYQHLKGKAPKLVAVERHDKVSFMSNYDIEKEDKGKISEYN